MPAFMPRYDPYHDWIIPADENTIYDDDASGSHAYFL